MPNGDLCAALWSSLPSGVSGSSLRALMQALDRSRKRKPSARHHSRRNAIQRRRDGLQDATVIALHHLLNDSLGR